MMENLISHLICTESYETFDNMEEWCDMSGFDYEEACFYIWERRKLLNELYMKKFKDDFEKIVGMAIEKAYVLRYY